MDIFVPVDLHRESINIDTPILIDIGGGTGTDVIEFRRRYPQISRRIILQELPTVIALVKENSTSLMTQVSVIQTASIREVILHNTK